MAIDYERARKWFLSDRDSNGGENGGNRKADQASSGDPINRAGAGNQGAFGTQTSDPFDARAGLEALKANERALQDAWNRASKYLIARGVGIGPVHTRQNMHYDPTLGTYTTVPTGPTFKNCVFITSNPEFTNPNAGLPSEGEIKVGEIIAWRGWRLQGGLLRSVYTEAVWLPGVPMRGNTGMYGIHAWKEMQEAYGYMKIRCRGVIGTVALWGDTIEHEHGYRAEWASVRSIDLLVNDDRSELLSASAQLTRLRETYITPRAMPDTEAQ